MPETTEEWFARKKKLALEVVEDFVANKIPILIVVEEPTANIFQCTLGDEIRKEMLRQREFPIYVHLCHSFETHLIDHFEKNHKVIWEKSDA